MSIFRLFTLIILSFCVAFSAKTQTSVDKFGALPETWAASISPNGEKLALGCSPTGVKAVCIYSLTTDAKPKLIAPPDDAEITGIFWASDKYLVYKIKMYETETTTNGLKQFEINRMISYDLAKEKSQILMRNVPSIYGGNAINSRLLNDDDNFITTITLVADNESSANSLIGNKGQLNHIVYKVSLKTGKAKVEEGKKRSTYGSTYDAFGKEIALTEWDLKTKMFRIVNVTNGRKVLFETRAEQRPLTVQGLGANADSLIVRFDDDSRFGLYEMQLSDGTITPVKFNDQAVGNPGIIEDPFTNQIVGYRYTDDLPVRFYTNETFAAIAKKAKAALKAESVLLTSWTQDKSAFTIAAINTGRPAAYYLFETNPDAISPLGGEAPWLDGVTLGKVESFTYSARDGMTLYGYVTYPPGKDVTARNLPLIMLPHGGPEARDTAGYDWLAQAIAHEGYLVIQPNFRGSSGYGQDYRNAGYGEFGGKMVDDVIDAAKWATSKGIATPDYCVVGWSYGGYSALMTTLKDASNVKCTVSINGVTDPGILYAETYRDGPGFAYWEDYVGDFFKRTKEQRLSFNPYDRAGEFKTPLLIIHGDKDLIVPVTQARKLSKKLGGKARYVEFDGEDHQLDNTISRKRLLTEVLAFLDTNYPS